MCAIQIVFEFQAPGLLVASTYAELLVPSTVAFHGYVGSQKPSLLVVNKRITLST